MAKEEEKSLSTSSSKSPRKTKSKGSKTKTRKEKKECRDDQIRNPATGRCVNRDSPKGKEVLAMLSSAGEEEKLIPQQRKSSKKTPLQGVSPKKTPVKEDLFSEGSLEQTLAEIQDKPIPNITDSKDSGFEEEEAEYTDGFEEVSDSDSDDEKEEKEEEEEDESAKCGKYDYNDIVSKNVKELRKLLKNEGFSVSKSAKLNANQACSYLSASECSEDYKCNEGFSCDIGNNKCIPTEADQGLVKYIYNGVTIIGTKKALKEFKKSKGLTKPKIIGSATFPEVGQETVSEEKPSSQNIALAESSSTTKESRSDVEELKDGDEVKTDVTPAEAGEAEEVKMFKEKEKAEKELKDGDEVKTVEESDDESEVKEESKTDVLKNIYKSKSYKKPPVEDININVIEDELQRLQSGKDAVANLSDIQRTAYQCLGLLA